MRRIAVVGAVAAMVLMIVGAGVSAVGAVERNDNIKHAAHIRNHDLPFTATNVDVSGLTEEPGEANAYADNGCLSSYRSLWYKVTVKETATYDVSTAGSNYDTTLLLYRSDKPTNFANLTLVACNDDSNGTLQSHVAPTLEPGTYYIAVGQYGIALYPIPDAGNRLDLSITKTP